MTHFYFLRNFLVLILCCIMFPAFSQQEHYIKLPFTPNKALKVNEEGFMLYDRFGNKFHESELRIPKTSSSIIPFSANGSGTLAFTTSNTCSVGKFEIVFIDDAPNYGFDSAQYRAVICTLFMDIDRLLAVKYRAGGVKDPIRILVGSDSAINGAGLIGVNLPMNVDIVGTSFYPIKKNLNNAWVDNIIHYSLMSGEPPFQNLLGYQQPSSLYDYASGILMVNFKNRQWCSGIYDTVIATNQKDLYTHALRQALIMLGLNSEMNATGNSKLGNNLYTRFDNHVYSNAISNKILSYNTSTKKVTKNLTPNIGCAGNNIFFSGVSASNITLYNDTPYRSDYNFNFFTCGGSGLCNSFYAKPNNHFVMVPCLGTGHTYIKRHPHPDEVKALCDIGYKLKNTGGVFAFGFHTYNDSTMGNVYKKYDSCSSYCLAAGTHDTINMDSVRTVTVNFASKILINDFPSTAGIFRMELLDTNKGTLTYNASSFTFTPKAGWKYGNITIVYFPQCDASAPLGNATYITLRFPYPPLKPCVTDKDCNYLCYGTFEESDDPLLWGNFNVFDAVPYDNTIDLFNSDNRTTCYKNFLYDFFYGCNEADSSCIIETDGLFPDVTGGNQFVGLFAGTGLSQPYSEGLHFKLKRPIYHNPSKVLRLKFLARTRYGSCPQFPIAVYGDDTLPDPIPTAIRPARIPGPGFTCRKFCDSMGQAMINSSTWQQYDIKLEQPKAGDSFTSIVIFTPPLTKPANEPKELELYGYFDNFVLYDSIEPKVTIVSNPDNITPCSDTSHTIDYYVCIPNIAGLNSDSIILKVDLPYGFTIASGSDFNAQGKYTIPIGTVGNTVCDTIKLKYNINYSVLDYNVGKDISVGYSSNGYCIEDIADVVRIYPQNKAVTLTKTVSKSNPIIGDTVTFSFNICNNSKYMIYDLELVDTLNSKLLALNYTGFNLNGSIVSKTISIDSANNGTPTCVNYSFTCIVQSDCKLENRAYISSPTNICFKAADTIMLNAGSTGSPITATIQPTSAVWCGNTIPLKAIIANPSGTYTYQWQKDGTNVGSNSANHGATSNGHYNVRISQNGCSSLIDGKDFDTAFVVTDSVTHTKCTASIGSIYVTPRNGLKPYTYAWSASASTDSFRVNLPSGSYTVTVTDSIGCNKVLNFTINRLYDTLLIVNKFFSHPICTASSGSISILSNGGTPPHTYLWNSGATTSSRSGLSTGAYYVTIMDQNGCLLHDTTTLTTVNKTLNVKDSVNKPQCGLNNGSIYLTPSGGYSSYYTYSWSNGSTQSSRLNIGTGLYYVTVTDTMGCTISDTIIVFAKPDTNFKTSDSIRSTLCYANSGAIYLYNLSGAAPYTFYWNSGHTTQDLVGMDSGTYSVTVIDNNGCVLNDTFYIPRVDGNVSFSWLQTNDCWNQLANISIQPSLGNPPYYIYWSDGDTARHRVNIPFGIYDVTVYDSLGCSMSYRYDLNFQNTLLTDKYTTHPNCGQKGSIRLVPENGFPPYEYFWEDLATVTSDSIRTNMNSGTYIVWTSDSKGCFRSDTIKLLPDLKPSSLDAYIQTKTSCQSGIQTQLQAIQIAGNPNVTYQWSTGANTANISVTNNSIKYTLTITEPNGCKKILSVIPSVDSFIRLGSGYGGYGYADLQSAITSGRLSSNHLTKLNLHIKGDFELNMNADIRYCNIVLGEAAKIDVPSDCNGNMVDSLIMLNNQVYTCGTKLAHGISIRECNQTGNMFGFQLLFHNNEVRDCYKGLEIRRSLMPYMTHNLFEDNLIGIHLWGDDIHVCTPFPQTIYLPNYLSIYDNKFRGSGTTSSAGKVKIPYNGMPLNQYTKFRPTSISTTTPYGVPLAGIIAENTRTLYLGHGNQASNSFENLNNGILTYGSQLYVYNTVFKDILSKSNSPIKEYAIYAEGNRYNLVGSLILGGYSSNALPHVQNTLNGIYVKDLENTSISGVYFKDVRYSVYSESNFGHMFNHQLTVNNNKIEGTNNTALMGIQILDNTADNNHVWIENNILTNVKQVGIRAIKNNYNFINSSLTIQNNTISGDAYRGIHLLSYQAAPSASTSVVKVSGNSCRFNYNMTYGIHYSNCKNITDKENTVKGTDPTYTNTVSGSVLNNPFGFFYENSTGTFSCNLVDSCYTGVRFFANCDASTWSKNKIKNHRLGLKVDTLATLRDQYWAGNTFSGTCFREAMTNQARPTTFYYSNTAPEYLPNPRFPSATNPWWQYSPKSGTPENGNCNPFIYTGGGESVPIGNKGDIIVKGGSGTFIPIGKFNDLVLGIEMTTTDTAVLMNNMVFGSFEPELTWQYRQELYTKIKPYEYELRDTSIFRDFLLQMEDGSIDQFTKINIIDREAYWAYQYYQLAIQDLRTSIDSAWEVIKGIDSAYVLAVDSTSLASLKQQRTLLRTWIFGRDTALRNLLMQSDTAYESELEQIQYVSDSVVPECVSDSLRNVFLATYYQTYAMGETDLSAPQIQTFTALAHRCPFEQLDAIYRSRGILWSRGDTTVYNDSLLCTPLGITLKSLRPIQHKPIRKERNLSFSVFPNPTSDMTNVQLSYVPDVDLTFVVTDILGRELYRETRFMNTNRLGINISQWDNGLYLLRILNGKTLLYHNQIQVIK